jgi:hypothetical protein
LIEAFPEDNAPRFLLRDRDSIYGNDFRQQVSGMQIEEVITAPQSPWQNPYVERAVLPNAGGLHRATTTETDGFILWLCREGTRTSADNE